MGTRKWWWWQNAGGGEVNMEVDARVCCSSGESRSPWRGQEVRWGIQDEECWWCRGLPLNLLVVCPVTEILLCYPVFGFFTVIPWIISWLKTYWSNWFLMGDCMGLNLSLSCEKAWLGLLAWVAWPWYRIWLISLPILFLTAAFLLAMTFSSRWVCWSVKDCVVILGYSVAHS